MTGANHLAGDLTLKQLKQTTSAVAHLYMIRAPVWPLTAHTQNAKVSPGTQTQEPAAQRGFAVVVARCSCRGGGLYIGGLICCFLESSRVFFLFLLSEDHKAKAALTEDLKITEWEKVFGRLFKFVCFRVVQTNSTHFVADTVIKMRRTLDALQETESSC